MRIKHECGRGERAAAYARRSTGAISAEGVERSEHPAAASDPLSLAARSECVEAMREMPDEVMLAKRAVLQLMEQAFIRGASWHHEQASAT